MLRMALKITIWGGRGSLPTPQTPETIRGRIASLVSAALHPGATRTVDPGGGPTGLPADRLGGYGGDTLCVEVSSPNQRVIIDGGTGIRQLGYELMAGPCGGGRGEVHVLLTHFHWDHLIGLLFFAPLFVPGNQIHFYAVQRELETVFTDLFKKPYFPVSLADLGADLHYHALEPRRERVIGGISIAPYRLDHPDPCWGFKIRQGGRTFSHCVDTECLRVSRDDLGDDLPLYQGVDLMSFDAQYTILEKFDRPDWGHAAAIVGLDIALRERIGKVVFMHHDPAATDEQLVLAEEQTRDYYHAVREISAKRGAPLPEVDWRFSRDGVTIEV